jgi:hypothetical protein
MAACAIMKVGVRDMIFFVGTTIGGSKNLCDCRGKAVVIFSRFFVRHEIFMHRIPTTFTTKQCIFFFGISK